MTTLRFRYSIFLVLSSLLVGLCSCCISPAHSNRNDWQGAENRIKSWAYFYEGMCHEQEQNWALAAESFYRAATLESKSGRIYAHLAKNLLFLGLLERSMEMLQKAEQWMGEKDYMLFFDIGTVYHLARRYRDAKRFYLKSLDVFPGFQKGAHALSNLPDEHKLLGHEEPKKFPGNWK